LEVHEAVVPFFVQCRPDCGRWSVALCGRLDDPYADRRAGHMIQPVSIRRFPARRDPLQRLRGELEGHTIEDANGPWKIHVYCAVFAEGCYWMEMAIDGARRFEILLRLTSSLSARKVVASVEAWLQTGETMGGGVHVHTVNEVSTSRVIESDTPEVDSDTDNEARPTRLDDFGLTACSTPDEAHTVLKPAHPMLKNLGETIRTLRAQRKLSQEALADLAAIDRSYMSGIERGRRNISVLHAARIAAALKVSLADLLRGDLREAPPLVAASAWRNSEDGMSMAVSAVTKALALRTRKEAGEWEVGRYLSIS